jgi:hypothetical protein
LNQGNKVRMPVMEVIWMLKIGQEHEWPTYVCSYSRNWVHFTFYLKNLLSCAVILSIHV